MRRFIVDTDTASDDAAALMIAALSEEIDLLGVTIVAGNVGLKQATDNALMTLEVCGSDAPVYLGAKRPLFRERHETISVHGKDGIKDVCTYCQIRYGFDYYVQPDKNAGQYVKRGHFDDESECA